MIPPSYAETVERDGYVVFPRILDDGTLRRLREALGRLPDGEGVRSRRGETYAVRDLLRLSPEVRDLSDSEAVRALVEPLLGREFRCVRGLLFDKTPAANWKVPWHQDLTVTVRERIETERFGPWSVKAGIPHVQAPVSVLAGMVAVRLHLDDTDEANGALRVLPGSHRQGRLSPEEIRAWTENGTPAVCVVPAGGGMVMRPLLLHASSAMHGSRHRRVIHLEYATGPLPGGLEWL